MIHKKHKRKSKKKRVARGALIAVRVSLRNHLIADNVEHRTTCKRKGKRKINFDIFRSAYTKRGIFSFFYKGRGIISGGVS